MQNMQNENREAEISANATQLTNCPSCRATLVAGMRFCRSCGYRLGEGVEEYAATRRFDGQIPTAQQQQRPTAAAGNNARNGAPFTPGQWGAMQPMMPLMNTSALEQKRASSMWNWTRSCRSMRSSWMMWMILAIAILSATGVISRGIRTRVWRPPVVIIGMQKSFVGVDGFDPPESGNGAMIRGIAAPDTPMERAGLLGGDIITSFDGHPVTDEDEMRRLIAATPVGKTVEILYTRDGTPGKTMLTTGDESSFHGMAALDARPGGQGRIGVSDFDRVKVPNSNIYGVQISDVDRNGPADLAGLHENDIVTEINGTPVRTEGDLRLRIYEAVPGTTANVKVTRGNEQLDIPVKIGRSKN